MLSERAEESSVWVSFGRFEEAAEERRVESSVEKFESEILQIEESSVAVLARVEALEDASACAVQKMARGRAARHYARALQASYARAATLIQAGARGLFHRRVVRLLQRRRHAVVRVQCAARRRLARVYCARWSDGQILKNNTFFKIDCPASDIVDQCM